MQIFRLSLAAALLSSPFALLAAEPSFPDVPADHFAFQAIESLKADHLVQGYDDGTFRPEQIVNRAEALKFIMGPLLGEEQQARSNGTSAFSDVSADAWYLPFVEAARTKGIIDSPPVKNAFHGADPVRKVEFLKMLELAHNRDSVHAFSEILLPISVDVQHTDAWFYPYIRYALTSSLLTVGSGGVLRPEKQLTRAETAVILYRLVQYDDGKGVESLLQMNGDDVQAVLASIEQQNVAQAAYASARALLYARGAHVQKPTDSLVVATLKTTESVRALVRAYQSMESGNRDEVIRLAKDAWQLADVGRKKSSGVTAIAERIQDMAASIANNARQSP